MLRRDSREEIGRAVSARDRRVSLVTSYDNSRFLIGFRESSTGTD